MEDHQLRVCWSPGFDSRLVRLQFFRFCQNFTSNFPFFFPFLFLSLSLYLRPFVCDIRPCSQITFSSKSSSSSTRVLDWESHLCFLYWNRAGCFRQLTAHVDPTLRVRTLYSRAIHKCWNTCGKVLKREKQWSRLYCKAKKQRRVCYVWYKVKKSLHAGVQMCHWSIASRDRHWRLWMQFLLDLVWSWTALVSAKHDQRIVAHYTAFEIECFKTFVPYTWKLF